MMNIYRKICAVISNFVKKVTDGINFRTKSKKIVKVQVSIIPLNQKRSKTYNRSIENKMVTQNIVKHFGLVRLRFRLLIFMRLTAEMENPMRLYGWSIPYTSPPYFANLPKISSLINS